MQEEDGFLNLLEAKLNIFFSFLSRHFFVLTFFYFLCALAIRVIFTPNNILMTDGFIYFLKAIEMARGDFSPMLSSAHGWPLFLSPFLYFLQAAGIYQKMFYVRILSDLLGALTIFPLAYLAKNLIKKENIYVPLSLFAFYIQLVLSDTNGYTESLFTFLLLMSLLFIYKAFKNFNYLLLASLFAALSFYVRQNGLFVFFIVVICIFLLRRHFNNFRYRQVLLSVLVFFIAVAPVFYQRYAYYGSTMFYGENSKYFVDNYRYQVWSPNIPVPTFTEYLKTHNIHDYFDKFFKNGVYKFFLSYYYVFSPAILFLFIFGFLIFFRRKIFLPLTAVFAVWTITLIPIWDVFGLPRHVYPTIPLIILFASAAVEELFKNSKYRHLGQSIFCAAFLVISCFGLISFYNSSSPDENYRKGFSQTAWADWVARNIRGKLAIQGGQEWIMSGLPDAEVGKIGAPYEYYAPKTGLFLVLPGYFNDLSSAMEWWKEREVAYVAIDNFYAERRPYLREISAKKPPYFKEVYSNVKFDLFWKMKIYKIDWGIYEKTKNK